uniref:Thiosulfate sulfurtransferase/rhodanese-like domain-containing protein 3 n=1 Tax=Phallusia mammillata TaxID=59560 RepID=A0A6F9DW08_9ASCI|nr:thiosulfate sulfurtransferase/rhodanese-like domain-containing protein 3 [Phallusia mammillata]
MSNASYFGEWLKAETRPEYVVSTQEMKELVKDDKTYLVDVRETDEVETGPICAKKYVNIPIGVLYHSLEMPDEEFKKKFDVEKPQKSDDLVFMCLGGIHSTFAFQMAKQLGYEGSKHYLDGYFGWEEGKKSEE